MALQPCRECGAQVSTEAKSCPHCGVPDPASRSDPHRSLYQQSLYQRSLDEGNARDVTRRSGATLVSSVGDCALNRPMSREVGR